MTGITNFTPTVYINGITLVADDLNNIQNALKGVLDLLIDGNNRTPLLPPGFSGTNTITTIINNSIISIDGSGNVVLTPRQFFDDAVASVAANTVSAAASATSAASSYNAALAIGSVLPAQAGNAGLGITTNGTTSSWGVSNAEAMAILNFIGYR